MIGYVFIRSGAIQTLQPERYPARQDQLDNLRYALEAIGEDNPPVYVEKMSVVKGLRSLPKLLTLLVYASKNSDKVFIDDFRRLFLPCPFERRGDFLNDLRNFGEVFWELQHGVRPLASLSNDGLAQLIEAQSHVRFRLKPKAATPGTAASRKRQTLRARKVSARTRSKNADNAAKKLVALRDELIAKHPSITLRAIAIEATNRKLKTSRGNPWSVSSVHRALKRGAKEIGTPNQTLPTA
jgi:hypothetical protein